MAALFDIELNDGPQSPETIGSDDDICIDGDDQERVSTVTWVESWDSWVEYVESLTQSVTDYYWLTECSH